MKALILVAPPPAPLNRLVDNGTLPLCGSTVLEVQVDLLRRHGVREILLVLGQGSEAIEHHFGDGQRFGVRMAALCSRHVVPTLGDLRAAHRFLDDTFVMLSTSALVATDLKALIAEHHSACAQATHALTDAAAPAIESNLMVIEPAALAELNPAMPLRSSAELATALEDSGARLHRAFRLLNWQPLNSPADYLQAHWQYLNHEWPNGRCNGDTQATRLDCGLNVSIDPRRCQIEGPVQIAGGVEIQDGAHLIGPCHIGAGSVVESGACIERSIVLPHVRVSRHAHLHEAITNGRLCVMADGTTIELDRADLGWLIGDYRQSIESRALSEQRFLDHIG